MVANVTYGYTSATFSGRCACPLVADSIVELARRTLDDAFSLANRWGAEQGGRWEGAKVSEGCWPAREEKRREGPRYST
jgi:DNA polymerase elongation subunit (family B)